MCNDCYNNCGGNTISDKCVVYTGPDITFLGISTGDSLSQLEAALIAQIESLLDGTGTTLEDLTLCDSIEDALNSTPHTVKNLFQAYADVICELRSDVDALEAIVNVPFSISAPCLTLPANPTRDQVLQATITKLCSVNTDVAAIKADYVKNSELCTKVNACLSATTSQEYTKMPKYVAVPYHGPLTVFDSQGRGLSGFGYDKIYICNGQTVGTFVTPDYRGRSPIGVNSGIPGGTLDSAVDPSLPQNVGYGFVNRTKNGTYTHTLTVNESASHTHTVNDPGHTHTLSMAAFPKDAGSSGTDHIEPYGTSSTGSSVTGITLNSSGGGQPHNNLHPVIGGVFIMHIP